MSLVCDVLRCCHQQQQQHHHHGHCNLGSICVSVIQLVMHLCSCCCISDTDCVRLQSSTQTLRQLITTFDFISAHVKQLFSCPRLITQQTLECHVFSTLRTHKQGDHNIWSVFSAVWWETKLQDNGSLLCIKDGTVDFQFEESSRKRCCCRCCWQSTPPQRIQTGQLILTLRHCCTILFFITLQKQ